MRLESHQEAVLLAVARFCAKTDRGALLESNMNEAFGELNLPAHFIRAVLIDLEDIAFVKRASTSQRFDGGWSASLRQRDNPRPTPPTLTSWELTSKGIAYVYGSFEEGVRVIREKRVDREASEGLVQPPNTQVPAADRFVSKSDNQSVYESAELAIEKLESSVVQSNDLFAREDDKRAVAAEISAFKSMMAGGRVRASALAAAKTCFEGIAKLAEKFGNAVVNAAAGAVVLHLITLLFG